jgi:hypothetical protein
MDLVPSRDKKSCRLAAGGGAPIITAITSLDTIPAGIDIHASNILFDKQCMTNCCIGRF